MERTFHLWKRQLLVFLAGGLILGSAAPGCGGGQSSAPPASAPAAEVVPEPVADAARRVLEQYRQAYEVRSADALTPLYAQSPDLILVQQGRAVIGWDAVNRELTGLMARAKQVRLELDDVRVLPVGEGGAAISARLTRTVGDGVTSVREQGMLTMTLRRQEQAWVIVSEHFSYPPTTP